MPSPEELARKDIDHQLTAAGWIVQDREGINLQVGRGVAVREFPLEGGFADYLLFVDRQPTGVVEAKPAGTTLSGVAEQSARYMTGTANLPNVSGPLRFAYESTGIETIFRDEQDPQPRSRRVFSFHRPEILAQWMAEKAEADGGTLRGRLQSMPRRIPLITKGLWSAQVEAITNLEESLANDRPRALIQMATGSGKTFTAVNAVYRLIKHAGARRVLFLVDRNNLGRQALREFQSFVTPDDGRKFGELYNVQRLTANAMDPVNKVIITTIQRLYSMLSGEPEFNEENEERSLWDLADALKAGPPRTVEYNTSIPVEFFDFIITDECHRSIYGLWRQVLEYFDAHLIGLTATPSQQTLGFFSQNLVMEYSRDRAVLDGVNVPGDVYRIRTEITKKGGKVDAGFWVDRRDRKTRKVRWEQLDEDLIYPPEMLDRDVVSENQIRTVVRVFRDKLFTEIFPGRTEVPKTLVFAKDDSHAEDIVRIIREEFDKGNEFCQKITYRTIGSAETLIADFRNSYYPRIAVTVDMIATGTDVKPIECLLFMRLVRSANYFEQMLGRGTRVITPSDLQAVTSDAPTKDRFVLVDAVGVVELEKVDPRTLERKRTVPFDKLLEAVAIGARDENTLTSLAGRLATLERKLTDANRKRLAKMVGAMDWSQRRHLPTADELERAPLRPLAHALLDAFDPDKILESAKEATGMDVPGEKALKEAAARLVESATAPFDFPELRNTLAAIHQASEQVIDTVSADRVIEAGYSAEDTERARATIASFRQFIETHRDQITALQIIYSQPYGRQHLTYRQVRELADALEQPPNSWKTEALWRAYAQLERDRVRGVNAKRVLTDLVSLVRHAVQLEDELVPFPERAQKRYLDWMAAQEAGGRTFTPEQRWWLDEIARQIGVNLMLTTDDLNVGEFFNRGGQVAAARLFGAVLPSLLDEMNAALVG
jgi:type I restriction enzyme R subunit